MGLFSKKIVREVRDGAWGHLVNKHGIDVDTISKTLRCVERQGPVDGKGMVTCLRVFRPEEARAKGIEVTGWETFDQHPELIVFEGYLTPKNEAFLERKRS